MAAASVTRTSSMARLRSGACGRRPSRASHAGDVSRSCPGVIGRSCYRGRAACGYPPGRERCGRPCWGSNPRWRPLIGRPPGRDPDRAEVAVGPVAHGAGGVQRVRSCGPTPPPTGAARGAPGRAGPRCRGRGRRCRSPVLGADPSVAGRGAQRQHRPPPAEPDPPGAGPRRRPAAVLRAAARLDGAVRAERRRRPGPVGTRSRSPPCRSSGSPGDRLGGRAVAWVTFFLALSSPFAINYATTARMYSLMILWSVLGFLALSRALEDPRPSRLVALGAVTAADAVHPLLGSLSGAGAGAGGWPGGLADRRGSGRSCGPSSLGVVVWLPWAPVFVFQALHTGTPWTSPASAGRPAGRLRRLRRGRRPWGALLMFATFALFLFGVFGP